MPDCSAANWSEKSTDTRTAADVTGRQEFDLVHDPVLYIDPDTAPTSPEGLRAWRNLVERALSFDPTRRPTTAAELAD